MEQSQYVIRARNCIALGFADYEAYLASQLWRDIRKRVTGDCVRCGKPRQHVHHSSYDLATMRGERIDALVPCCARCHRIGEKLGRGQDDRVSFVTLFLVTPIDQTRKAHMHRRRKMARVTTKHSKNVLIAKRIDEQRRKAQAQLQPRLLKWKAE